jgi:hypothetical protein
MPATDLDTRIRAYIATMPLAISVAGGHVATLKVATVLVVGFALSVDDAWPYLEEFNQRCEPQWSPRELGHKLAEAAKNKQGLVHGCLLDGVRPVPDTTRSTRPPPRKELTKEEKIRLWTHAVTTKLNGWEADPYETLGDKPDSIV